MAERKVRKVKGTTSGPTVGSGRTTPKGTTPGGRAPEASMRYTPPTVRLDKPSPRI
ncbi:MAG: hypothetical protein H0U26_10225, partial [Acidimicrobiia bacterium]|nr:hypothetical protein [Acidimicrobiia bacterium]